MSARRWKRARSMLRPTERRMDRTERARYRVPWYLRLLCALSRRVRLWHYGRWNRIHEAALRRAVKVVAHATIAATTAKQQEAPRG